MSDFRPAEHVRKRAEFELIYKTGFKRSGRLMTMFTRERDAGPARLGIAATRKMGAAVERNRAKRLVRELFRHNKPATAVDVVVVPRREMLDAPYERIEAEFLALLSNLSTRQRSVPPNAGSLKAGSEVQRLCLALIRIYKLTLSPLFAGSCRYTPGCADYVSESIARHGVVRGGWLGTKRLCRCHPFGGHGYDPVPTSLDHPIGHQIVTSLDQQIDH